MKSRLLPFLTAIFMCLLPVSVCAEDILPAESQISDNNDRVHDLLLEMAQFGAGTIDSVSIHDPLFLALYCSKAADGLSLTLTEYHRQISFPLQAADVPAFQGSPYVYVHHNLPYFDEDPRKITETFESYSELDSLGRCGSAFALIGTETMPTEERGQIGSIKPSGWHTIKYDFIDGKYLYNRCHLIGYQLAGENANPLNLITGTRYLNTIGMLPFENRIADYVHQTGNHVLYRVTPIYEDDNLLANGVLLEAFSMEDRGRGLCFAVFCYNVQPGIEIDYRNGDSWLLGEESPSPESTWTETQSALETTTASTDTDETPNSITYVLNTRSKRFHYPDCESVSQIKEKNKAEYSGTREQLIEEGYQPCGSCKP